MSAAAAPVDLPVAEVLRRRQVRAVFQPVIDLADGALAGYEGFARVGPGEGGLPGEWLAAAEARGLRADLELLCIEVIAAAGRPPDGGLLFVNSSLSTLLDERILALRSRFASDLVIDLTSHDARLDDQDWARLAPLIGSGVRLAVDDSSSVSFLDLARIRPSFVKIDREIVRDLDTDPDHRALVAAIVRFGEDVGFQVVAECVERSEELEALQEAGVPFAQGHLLGRPSTGWSATSRLRAARLSSLEVDRGVRQRLRSATNVQEASDVVTADLAAPHLFPAVYIERSGVLRCLSERGFWQVLDGIPTTAGVMGRAHRTGNRIVLQDVRSDPDYLESRTDVVAQVVEPIWAGGRVVGCLEVESDRMLDGGALTRVNRVAQLLSDRLNRLGLRQDESALTRLARSSKELAGLSDEVDLERAVVRLACEVSGMSTAALYLPGENTEISLRAVQGPLAVAFRTLDPAVVGTMVDRVEAVSSCHAGHHERSPALAGLDWLRRQGADTVAVLPMRLLGRGTGLLVIAHPTPVPMSAEHVEAIELLATESARAFDLAGMVAELRDRATRDPVTGLQNQRAFEEILAAIGGRRSGRWAVLMADIDGFKAVNDSHGHLVGDRLLRELASALNEVMRPMDRLYRIGGDEFAAVLSQLGPEEALIVGNRLCEAANAVLDGYGASLSIGIALPEPDETAEQFVARADASLYEAKRGAPGSVRLGRQRGVWSS